jgi:hypothetical protein
VDETPGWQKRHGVPLLGTLNDSPMEKFATDAMAIMNGLKADGGKEVFRRGGNLNRFVH